ncbi:MAG TPA: response regulator [Polyangiaceae bacterium]|nr:response regulator [Polyangiaceae bacterium]
MADVLIIDDDIELREALAEGLSMEGFRVATVGNGREGLDYLQEAIPPHVILVDLIMPIMNGWQFCEAKNADPRLARIPVVALSAAAKKDPTSPYFLDVQDIVVKPVMMDELLSVVRRFVPSTLPSR